MLRLLGFTEAVPFALLTGRDEHGWKIAGHGNDLQQRFGTDRLNDFYRRTDPNFTGRGTSAGFWAQEPALRPRSGVARDDVNAAASQARGTQPEEIRKSRAGSSTNMQGGQDRGRTGDLPLFRRTLVPTELPGHCLSAATPTGLEPATSAVTGRRANQLRYGASCEGRCPFGQLEKHNVAGPWV